MGVDYSIAVRSGAIWQRFPSKPGQVRLLLARTDRGHIARNEETQHILDVPVSIERGMLSIDLQWR
jgi:hypothetical protein